MSTDRSAENLVGLFRELCKLPHETEWVEFKVNNSDPQVSRNSNLFNLLRDIWLLDGCLMGTAGFASKPRSV